MLFKYPKDLHRDVADMKRSKLKEDVALMKSIREEGIQSPILVTLDGWIIKGRRRYVAAKACGLDDSQIFHRIMYDEEAPIVWMLTGIFHAFDPLGMRSYHNTEYRGYAHHLANAGLLPDSGGYHTAESVDGWMKAHYSDYGFLGTECYEKLCAALADAL